MKTGIDFTKNDIDFVGTRSDCLRGNAHREVFNGVPQTQWLTTGLARFARRAQVLCEDVESTSQIRTSAPTVLRDASVHLDVAAAVYRLLLEKPTEGRVDLADCLAVATAAALGPLGLRQRSSLEFYFGEGCTIPAAQALPVMAIALEAIINALRHAHPSGVVGRMSVACRREGRFIILEVNDDGVGLPEGFDPLRDAGAGLRSMFDTAETIDAQVDLQSHPLGLTVRVRMWAAAATLA